jgi:hypothetical protein
MVSKYGIDESAVMTLVCACCVPCSYYQMIFEVLSACHFFLAPKFCLSK